MLDISKLILNEKEDIPLYQQLAAGLRDLIEQTDIETTEDIRLPTVRDLASRLNLSLGTVKHAYNVLAAESLIDLVQGKGTFVRTRAIAEPVSKKDEAMQAIDRMLDTLDQLGFSNREKQIFFDLKMRERDERLVNLQVGIVDSSAETRSVLQNCLSSISYLDLYRYPLDELADSPEAILSQLDLLVTSDRHYYELKRLLEDKNAACQLVVIGLNVAPESLAELLSLPGETRLGIISQTRTFGAIMSGYCRQFTDLLRQPTRCLFTSNHLSDFIADHDVLLIPSESFTYLSAAAEEMIRQFKRTGGRLIPFQYSCETGSMIHLRETVERSLRRLHQNRSGKKTRADYALERKEYEG